VDELAHLQSCAFKRLKNAFERVKYTFERVEYAFRRTSIRPVLRFAL
jgi:hypothetical protein